MLFIRPDIRRDIRRDYPPPRNRFYLDPGHWQLYSCHHVTTRGLQRLAANQALLVPLYLESISNVTTLEPQQRDTEK